MKIMEEKDMRCNQVSIDIERFGKYVPERYPDNVQRIRVYCDDYNSIYAALSKAYAMAINTLAEYETIGCKTNVYTNEFDMTDSKPYLNLPILRRRYEDDTNFQYTRSAKELHKDQMWIYENADKILETLRQCKDQDEFVVKLKEQFELTDYQIKKLSQVRLEMLTEAEYQNNKNEVERLSKDYLAGDEESMKRYRKLKLREIKVEIEKINAYFVMADNCEKILKTMMEMTEIGEFEKEMEKTYGIDRRVATMLKHLKLNDFTPKEREKKQKEKEDLLSLQEYYTNKERR